MLNYSEDWKLSGTHNQPLSSHLVGNWIPLYHTFKEYITYIYHAMPCHSMSVCQRYAVHDGSDGNCNQPSYWINAEPC
jgi:hypothetical protein